MSGVPVSQSLAAMFLVIIASSAYATPIPAADAGYTTLAFRSDFTDPYYANLSNWLDCAGAAYPQWWAGGFAGRPAPDCSRYSIINDNGTQALDLKFTAADVANEATLLTSVDPQTFVRGADFPNGAYYEITMRVTPQSIDGNWWGAGAYAFWTWSNSGALGLSPSFDEHDFLEGYGNGGDGHENYTDTCVKGNYPTTAVCPEGWGVYYDFDPRQIFKFGALITQDGGSNLGICTFINDVKQVCASRSDMTPSEVNERNYLILESGFDQYPVWADIDLLIEDVEVWTCYPTDSGPDAFGVPQRTCNRPVIAQ